MKVLVVDDDAVLGELLAERLGASGHQVRWAGDAMKAVLDAESLLPDIVLCDIMMPAWGSGIDAFQVLRRIKGLEDVPVIFVTALPEARARGMLPQDSKVRLLRKPVDWAALEGMIRELTGGGR